MADVVRSPKGRGEGNDRVTSCRRAAKRKRTLGFAVLLAAGSPRLWAGAWVCCAFGWLQCLSSCLLWRVLRAFSAPFPTAGFGGTAPSRLPSHNPARTRRGYRSVQCSVPEVGDPCRAVARARVRVPDGFSLILHGTTGPEVQRTGF